MKIGIIGAGTIGQKHVEAAGSAGIDVGWIVDKNLQLACDLATACSAQHAEKPDPLWSDESTDAVVIAVPNYLHQTLATAALKAGKDVLLEKPMALNHKQCTEISEVVEESDQILQIGFVHRFTEVAKIAKQLANSGKLGEIYHAQAFLFLRRNIPGLGKMVYRAGVFWWRCSD